VGAGLDFAGDALDDFDAGALQGFYLFGIVGKQADASYAQGFEHLAGECEVALVGLEAQALVGFDGVETGVLQFISL